jgi:hypothetical protein
MERRHDEPFEAADHRHVVCAVRATARDDRRRGVQRLAGRRWHWPFAKRFWTPSPLDDTWVWSTAFAITLALALISRRLTPDEWDGRRDQLNSPIDDETHIMHVDERRDSAPPRANVQRADDATPPRARHSP